MKSLNEPVNGIFFAIEFIIGDKLTVVLFQQITIHLVLLFHLIMNEREGESTLLHVHFHHHIHIILYPATLLLLFIYTFLSCSIKYCTSTAIIVANSIAWFTWALLIFLSYSINYPNCQSRCMLFYVCSKGKGSCFLNQDIQHDLLPPSCDLLF